MIVVVLSTRNRPEYARETLESLIRFLKPGTEKLRLHIADAGTEDKESVQRLMSRACTEWGTQPSFTCVPGATLGQSLNAAVSWIDVDNLWMYAADEWCLTRHLYLDRAAQFIRTRFYDMVRLGPIHPDLVCTTRFDSALGWWLDIHSDRDLSDLAFAARPFLASRRLLSKAGPFAESVDYDGALYDAVVDLRLASINMRGPWKNLANPHSGRVGGHD